MRAGFEEIIRRPSVWETPAVEPQTVDNDTPMLDDFPNLQPESLGLEDASSLNFKQRKVLRKRVRPPKWVRAVTKLLEH